jgi:hypothetical protein
VLPLIRFSLLACTSWSLLTCEEGSEQAGYAPVEALMHDLDPILPPLRVPWEEPWPPECNQRGHAKLLPTEAYLPEEAVWETAQTSVQAQPLEHER